MDSVSIGRALMGDSLGFHIIIALLSIGIPFLMNIFEWYAWRKNDERVASFVRLLSRWTAVLAISGVISGTIISLQFSTLWAPFIAESRPYIGKFFALEGYAFLLEAVFLSWYLMTQKTMSAGKHFLIGIPITIGAVGSAFFITIVNAWMNNPSGIFTITSVLEITHSVTAYFLASTLFVIGFVAWRVWRSKSNDPFPQWLLLRLGVIGAVLLVVVALLGHQSAVDIAHSQPSKLAAIEILDKTQKNAPLRIGGSINDDGKAEGGIVLPGVLSLLSGYSLDYEVHGLDEIARDKWPLLIVHELFDLKMMLVGLISALIAGILFFYWRFKKQPRWFVKILAIFGGTGIILVELGWMLTELGRQPYAIAGQMLVKDAFSKNINVAQVGYIFPTLFVILLCVTGFAIAMTTKRWRKKETVKW